VTRILYLVFGLGLLGATTVADSRGWLIPRADRLQNVPRSIRDNPGAWRSIYRGSPRNFGGK
jgi:uncharacterized protein (DUF2461 family)